MTTQEKIEILQAYERGEEIELYRSGWIKIEDKVDYQFNFQDYHYRIKPKRWRANEKGIYYY